MSGYRHRIGNRRHRADIYQHDGSVDGFGQPDKHEAGSWTEYIADWPCEIITASGGESIRGRQVSETTTHVFFGEYFGATGITSKMKIIVDSQTYAINSVYDPAGDSREMRVEGKIEDSQ